MKEILQNGAKLFLRTIIVNIMCFFVVMSFSVLATAAFTKNIGYKAYGTLGDSSTTEELYTYYYDDGDDLKKQEYEDKGYKITESSVRSTLSGKGETVFLVVSQIFCVLILISFVYPGMWQLGTKDSNLVKFKHKKEDRLKGLKIGLAAVTPIYVILLLTLISPSFPTVLYKLLNAGLYSLTELITSSAKTVSELSVGRYLLLLVLPLLIPAISCAAYLLGFNNYSVSERLIYKKKNGGKN